jgi:asparagine synthase (glutamine-hydrolysing)
MCGITGYLTRAANDAALALAASVQKLGHRGPDENSVWREGAAALGHTRLSIIDLSGGQQPMKSPDGRYIIVFNGEIYNFQEIRTALEKRGERFQGHSDTDVLLRAFVRDGFERCLEQLRGMFAFAVWDRQTQTLSIARDRLGVKPLVYAETAQGFLFASEIQALFALDPTLSRQVDAQAIDHYLTFQYIPAPLSGFRAIRKLPPAHAMVVKAGRIVKQWRYWDIDLSRRSSLSFDEACEALREKTLEATRIRLISDVPLGAFLSGGIDSSITVAAMARLGANPLKTFAIGFEEERFNELPYARQIANHLGTDHHEMTVRPDAFEIMPKMIEHLGEPLADNSVMPTYYVAKFARSQLTVALTGDGGDEIFAGYRRFYQIRRVEWLARQGLAPVWRGLRRGTIALEGLFKPAKRQRRFPVTRADQVLSMSGIARYQHLLAFFPDEEKEALVTPAFRASAGDPSETDYLQRHWERPGGDDVLNRYLYLDMVTYLPEDILFKVDVASMANSLECRSPFLDHQLIEFAMSLPGHYKLTPRGRHKHILKEAFKEWLPPGFMAREKKGFSVPLSSWLKKDLAEMVRHYLLGSTRFAHYFRRDVVERYVEQHLSGKESHSSRLWALLVLALWMEQYRVEL